MRLSSQLLLTFLLISLWQIALITALAARAVAPRRVQALAQPRVALAFVQHHLPALRRGRPATWTGSAARATR